MAERIHPMTPDELKKIIRQVFREEQEIFREAIREELKDAGLFIGDKEDNRAVAKDFQFLRSWREKFDGASSRVGGAVILALVGGAMWLIAEAVKLLWGRGI